MQKMCICEVTRLLQLRSTSRLRKVRHCYRTSAAAETEAVFQQSSIHICKLSLNLAPAQFHHRQQLLQQVGKAGAQAAQVDAWQGHQLLQYLQGIGCCLGGSLGGGLSGHTASGGQSLQQHSMVSREGAPTNRDATGSRVASAPAEVGLAEAGGGGSSTGLQTDKEVKLRWQAITKQLLLPSAYLNLSNSPALCIAIDMATKQETAQVSLASQRQQAPNGLPCSRAAVCIHSACTCSAALRSFLPPELAPRAVQCCHVHYSHQALLSPKHSTPLLPQAARDSSTLVHIAAEAYLLQQAGM
eukprot:jgi/Astpho2/7999/fgenesh1_pg.00119_%23_30_t